MGQVIGLQTSRLSNTLPSMVDMAEITPANALILMGLSGLGLQASGNMCWMQCCHRCWGGVIMGLWRAYMVLMVVIGGPNGGCEWVNVGK